MLNSTLIFLIKKNEDQEITDICLAMKKRSFGVGKWNGVGGKVVGEESIEEAAIRETMEEISVTIKDLNKIAELEFTFSHKPDWDQIVHVYFTTEWIGEPIESEEMNPKWFKIDQVPFDSMWPDDILATLCDRREAG